VANSSVAVSRTFWRVSIALVTRNRPQWLDRCLESWRNQSPQPYEIVISDDSDAELEPVNQALARKYSARWIRGPKRGLYANRNCAALACTGTHIMSADDDHTHPLGFVAAVQELLISAPQRVWIFSEKNPAFPEAPLVCPAELRIDGTYGPPQDPSDCAAIACGSSIYPRRVFDIGLRYDETYPFGNIWYLWGHVLRRAGFRISCSYQTFVWHHVESALDRTGDNTWLRDQMECNLYVAGVVALRMSPSPAALGRLIKVAVTSVWPGTKMHGQSHRVKPGISRVLRALRRSWVAPVGQC
jgi:glycosyltransferase involved in cell wall biosynthesis